MLLAPFFFKAPIVRSISSPSLYRVGRDQQNQIETNRKKMRLEFLYYPGKTTWISQILRSMGPKSWHLSPTSPSFPFLPITYTRLIAFSQALCWAVGMWQFQVSVSRGSGREREISQINWQAVTIQNSNAEVCAEYEGSLELRPLPKHTHYPL